MTRRGFLTALLGGAATCALAPVTSALPTPSALPAELAVTWKAVEQQFIVTVDLAEEADKTATVWTWQPPQETWQQV